MMQILAADAPELAWLARLADFGFSGVLIAGAVVIYVRIVQPSMEQTARNAATWAVAASKIDEAVGKLAQLTERLDRSLGECRHREDELRSAALELKTLAEYLRAANKDQPPSNKKQT